MGSDKPVFKNVHYEKVLVLGTPRGVSVTVRPGCYVRGEYFRHIAEFHERGSLVEVRGEERDNIPPHKLDFDCD